MADTRLPALTEQTVFAPDDNFYSTDTSDTTDHASGSSRRSEFAKAFGPFISMPEISITGAVTATINRMHVCTGTSADYTVTLPAASGNANRWIGFRMAPLASLSKRVTLDGNSSETIDGLTTRVMWAGEWVILRCDGSNWFKYMGQSIPMLCQLESASATTANHDTATKFDLATSLIDNTGMMADTANDRIVVKRDANYSVGGMINFEGLADQVRVILYLYKGSSPSAYKIFAAFTSGVHPLTAYSPGTVTIPLVVGDFVELWGSWDVSGGSSTESSTVAFGLLKPFLFCNEQVGW